ncbi:hypothetical protein BSL82_14005 [Tardibacter chloracetimidivorans]|uniref:Uncharacterized protein n=1 Tax=Tardibacter chloracetimidivorans TaxID=1921510 RepID=A0A1L3ZXB1_9SPHN|nr:hypothetical protein [Tardibacter chloracetimidivorans]API60264.1 hypothetical protein BSL82_14005 [Tardibacter chloracetimidivorans]
MSDTRLRLAPRTWGKLGNKPGEPTPWDQNFETVFHQADAGFPAVIDWLEGLTFEARPGQPRRSRFLPQPAASTQPIQFD